MYFQFLYLLLDSRVGKQGMNLTYGDQYMAYYNHERYHESLNNLKPVDVYEGRGKQILDRREKIKQRTLRMRRHLNLGNARCVS